MLGTALALVVVGAGGRGGLVALALLQLPAIAMVLRRLKYCHALGVGGGRAYCKDLGRCRSKQSISLTAGSSLVIGA